MKHATCLLELRYPDIYWGVSMYCAQSDIFENIVYWASLKPEVVLNSGDELIQREKTCAPTHKRACAHTYMLKLSVLFVANSYICSITFGHFNVYSGLSPCKRTSSGTEAKTCFLPFRTLSLFKDASAFRWCGSTCLFYILNTTQFCWFHTSFHSFCLACAYGKKLEI